MKYKECILLTLLLTLVSFYSTESYGMFQKISVRDFSLNYDGSYGAASFDHLQFLAKTVEVDAEDFQVDIEKQTDSLTLSQTLTKIKLATKEGDMFSSLGRTQISGLHLSLSPTSKLALSFDLADVEIGDGSHRVQNLQMKCQSGSSRNGDLFGFLVPCTKYGELKLPELNLSKNSSQSLHNAFDIKSFAEIYIEEGEQFEIKGLVPDKIKDVALKIVDNKFNLSGKVNILFNLKLKGHGNIQYHAQTSELEIHLAKVKVGIIGITKKVLSAVKDAKLKNVRVQGSSIFVQF